MPTFAFDSVHNSLDTNSQHNKAEAEFASEWRRICGLVDIMAYIMADWPTALSAAQSATWPTIFGRQLSASATSPTKSNEKLKIGCAQFQTDNK